MEALERLDGLWVAQMRLQELADVAALMRAGWVQLTQEWPGTLTGQVTIRATAIPLWRVPRRPGG